MICEFSKFCLICLIFVAFWKQWYLKLISSCTKSSLIYLLLRILIFPKSNWFWSIQIFILNLFLWVNHLYTLLLNRRIIRSLLWCYGIIFSLFKTFFFNLTQSFIRISDLIFQFFIFNWQSTNFLIQIFHLTFVLNSCSWKSFFCFSLINFLLRINLS